MYMLAKPHVMPVLIFRVFIIYVTYRHNLFPGLYIFSFPSGKWEMMFNEYSIALRKLFELLKKDTVVAIFGVLMKVVNFNHFRLQIV